MSYYIYFEDFESLFLGFLKEDLFYFFYIIFQDFLFFIYLYRIVLFLADITYVACPKQFILQQTHVQELVVVSLAIRQGSKDPKHLTPGKRAPRKQG